MDLTDIISQCDSKQFVLQILISILYLGHIHKLVSSHWNYFVKKNTLYAASVIKSGDHRQGSRGGHVSQLGPYT